MELKLAVDRSGRLTGVEIVKPSGYGDLDASAIDAVKRADRYPPIPDGIEVDPLTIMLEMVLTPD